MSDLPEEQQLRAWFRQYGPPAPDPSHAFDRERWPVPLAPPRHLFRNVAGLVAGAAALLLMVRVLPAMGRAAVGAVFHPHPPAIAFYASRYVSSPGGPPGDVTGGTVTRIANPKAFHATRVLAPLTTDIFEVKYYVVAGIREHGTWSYPMGITVPPGGTLGWNIFGFPIARDSANHTQLMEVGVVPQSFTP